ncbi:MAG: sulfite exporter TauE/SafE family protein [Synechococcus sp.]|nr:sulfite exporter TauE/SafE family protein [Synechococcus sp.]
MSELLLPLALAVVAFLYGSVGHAGATGYIAVFALAGLAPEQIRPLALMLNLLVASFGAWQFWRAGHLQARRFWPLLPLAVPAAFMGGWLNLPSQGLRWLLGLVLLFASLRFLFQPADPPRCAAPGPVTLAFTGAGLGFLAGLTGTGGGVFLSPLMLLRRWCSTHQAAAVSVLFIWVNSLAGLLGLLRSGQSLPPLPWLWALVVLLAGGLGAHAGSRRWAVPTIRRSLALVTGFAGSKLLLG